MDNLSNEVIVYNAIKERLKADFGLEEDDAWLFDTLDGQTCLREMIVHLARQARHAEAYAHAVATVTADNQARKKRFEDRAVRLRKMALWAMTESGMINIEEPDITVTQRSGGLPAVVILDEDAVPLEYCKTHPDIAKIREALQAGKQLDFAVFANAKPSLFIRMK